MFNSRYSEPEQQQWHDACSNQSDSKDAARHNGASASMAKGQAEKKHTRAATAAKQAQKAGHNDWASECLFDCYNG